MVDCQYPKLRFHSEKTKAAIIQNWISRQKTNNESTLVEIAFETTESKSPDSINIPLPWTCLSK